MRTEDTSLNSGVGTATKTVEVLPEVVHLRAVRAALHLSMQGLSERCGLGITTVARMERGTTSTMTKRVIVAYYQTLGITFERQMDGAISIHFPRDLPPLCR